MSEICYGCFKEIHDNWICPYCGYVEKNDEGRFHNALHPESILNGRYIVGRVINQSRCVTSYVAKDYQTEERVCIRECLPIPIVERESNNSVSIMQPELAQDFLSVKKGLLYEAKMLANFIECGSIIKIKSYFEENNTAYVVTEYADGCNLRQYVEKKGGRLGNKETRDILTHLFNAVKTVHGKGIIHRNIAPETIIVCSSGPVKLTGFGDARNISENGYTTLNEVIASLESTGDKHQISNFVNHDGFSPLEQYSRNARQSYYTDVYLLAAVVYFLITGVVPPEALSRMENDELQPLSSYGVSIGRKAEEALMKALSINADGRYQKLDDFIADFNIDLRAGRNA